MSNLATIVNNILADSGIDDINVVVTTGSYANPAWITSLAWTKITGTPSFVTGSGSAGQVAYWSSGSAITGESNLFWDATNDRLGVGINAPRTVLDVATGASNALGIGNVSDTISSGDLIGAISFLSRDGSVFSSGGVSNIRSYATTTYNSGAVSADLRFYVSNSLQNTTQAILFGTEAMRIFSAGNIASFNEKSFLTYQAGDSSRYGSFFTNNNGTVLSSWDGAGEPLFLWAPSSTASIRFCVNGNISTGERMRLNNLGQLGIGVTNISALLHLGGTSPYIFFDDTSTTGTLNRFKIIVGDVGTTQTTTLGFDNTSGTANLDVMSINELGRVGIGDNGPSSKLQVNGDIRISGTGAGIDGYDGGFLDYNLSTLIIRGQASTGGAISLRTSANGASSVSSERINIGSSGRIILKSNSNIPSASNRYFEYDFSIGTFKFNDNNSVSPLVVENTYAGFGVGILFNLGYGGDADLVGTAINAGRIFSIPENPFTATASTQDASLIFQTVQNGSLLSRFQIFSTGQLKGSAYGGGNFTGTVAYNLAVDASGNIIETAGGVVDGSGTANYIPRWQDANTLTNSIIYDDGTNVGIGTNVPNVKLDIRSSDSGGTRLRIRNENNSGVASLIINPEGAGAAVGDATVFYDVNSTAWVAGVDKSDSSKYKISNDPNADFRAGNYFTIQTNGNVGIDTISPSYRLDVRINSSAAYSNSYGNVLQIANTSPTTGSFAGIGFSAEPTSGNACTASINVVSISNGSAALTFGTRGNSVFAERVRINQVGDLLVNTTNADIGGSVNGISLNNGNKILVANNTTGIASFLFYGDRRGTNNTGGVYMLGMGGYYKSSIGVLGTNNVTNDGGITFNTISGNSTAVTRMSVTTSGISVTGTGIFSGSVTSDGLFKSNQGVFQIFVGGAFRGGLYNYASASGSGSDYSTTLLSETDIFFTSGGSVAKRMTILGSNGYVGIGETNPATLLQLSNSSVSSGGSSLSAYGFDGAANFYTTRGESPANIALYLYNNPTSGTGYGTGVSFRAKSDTVNSRIQGNIYTSWTNNSDAGRTSQMVFTTTNATSESAKMWLAGNGNLGIGQSGPSGRLHVTSTGITASQPSLGWPVYNAENDANARNIYIDTAGNGSVGTAGSGATVVVNLGQYYDSRVVITPSGNGGASPADQGMGRGKDLMLKAGTSDNGVGYKGGRLYLNGGMGYQSAYNANGGDILMQSLTGSGNVLVGLSSDIGGKFQVGGNVRAESFAIYRASSFRGGLYTYADITGSGSDRGITIFAEGGTNNGNIYFCPNGSVTKVMTVNTSSNVFIGTTTTVGPVQGKLDIEYNGINSYGMNLKTSWSGGGLAISFNYSTSAQVGSITTTSSSTSYNTSSDYRLKQDLKDFNGLDLINKIKTYDFEWATDKTRSYGVVAHELQEVINYAVQGQKDAQIMQGVDYSKLVPILIKAIQEQQQQIDALKTN